jgi:hypothetical protein
MNDEKYELGSPDWLAMLKGIFEQILAAGGQSDDVEFSMCEVYTDVPARISAEPQVAWYLRVKAGEMIFLTEEVDDVDIKIVGQWALLSKLSSLEYGEAGLPPDAAAEVAKATEERTFLFTASPTMQPPPPGFAAVHNQVARRTL